MTVYFFILLIVEKEKSKLNLFTLKQLWSLYLQSIRHLFWPAVCINCKDSICETYSDLCKNCWDQLIISTGNDYCTRCGRDASIAGIINDTCPDCQGKKIYFDKIARSGFYDKTLQEMILAFKNGKSELDSTLGFLANSALQGSSFTKEIDFFIPVPLHWARRLARGYNQ